MAKGLPSGLWGWHRRGLRVHGGSLRGGNNSDSSETESGGELEEAVAGWTSTNGIVFWSSTTTEKLCYVPAARSLIPGPTHYAVARISDIQRCTALLTDDILQHIVSMTNLEIAGHLPSSTTWLIFPITTPTSCQSWQQENRTGGGSSLKRWEKCWWPHTSRREGAFPAHQPLQQWCQICKVLQYCMRCFSQLLLFSWSVLKCKGMMCVLISVTLYFEGHL